MIPNISWVLFMKDRGNTILFMKRCGLIFPRNIPIFLENRFNVIGNSLGATFWKCTVPRIVNSQSRAKHWGCMRSDLDSVMVILPRSAVVANCMTFCGPWDLVTFGHPPVVPHGVHGTDWMPISPKNLLPRLHPTAVPRMSICKYVTPCSSSRCGVGKNITFTLNNPRGLKWFINERWREFFWTPIGPYVTCALLGNLFTPIPKILLGSELRFLPHQTLSTGLWKDANA